MVIKNNTIMSSKLSKVEFNPPKGMRDIDDQKKLSILDTLINGMVKIFKRYGAIRVIPQYWKI